MVESAWNAGDLGSIPKSGRSSREENGNPLWYSCLENSMDRGCWWALVHGVTVRHNWATNFMCILLPCLEFCFTLLAKFKPWFCFIEWDAVPLGFPKLVLKKKKKIDGSTFRNCKWLGHATSFYKHEKSPWRLEFWSLSFTFEQLFMLESMCFCKLSWIIFQNNIVYNISKGTTTKKTHNGFVILSGDLY